MPDGRPDGEESPADEDPASAGAAHDPYEAWRFPNFRLYAGGWFLLLIGTRIQSVAIGWDVYDRTGEALALGLVGLVQAIPVISLAIPAGFLADRFHRKTVVILSVAGATITSAILCVVALVEASTHVLYIVLLLDACMITLGRPARNALLPQLVPRESFHNVVTWNTTMFQISSVVGPAIGGFLIAIEPWIAYGTCALMSAVFAVLMLRVEAGPRVEQTEPVSWRSLLAGLTYLRNTPAVLSIVTLDMFAVMLGGAVFLLPIYAKDILHVGATGLGWLTSAPALGALCMALTVAHLPPMKKAGRNLLIAVAGFGVATIIFGVSKVFWLSWVALFMTGALDNISVVVRHTMVQMLTPDAMRGRVSAVNTVFISASNEIGGLESGVVAHWFGPVISVVSGGIGTILVVILMAIKAPSIRRLGSLRHAGSD